MNIIKKKMTSLFNINFKNTQINNLIVTKLNNNKTPQTTPDTNYSYADPTPIENPYFICYNKNLSKIMGIEIENESLDLDKIKPIINEKKDIITSESSNLEILSGNKIAKNSIPIAHCYCGYQFGHFAGQLGDGRAITLGDYFNENSSLFEIQLKGSGLTPYSRSADGRAVLRSSIREYFASEYLYRLGFPTTRALSLIGSTSLALRDPNYNGNVIKEECAIVSRIAQSFIRFGSFEIFVESNRSKGPSVNSIKTMFPDMINYLLKYHYNSLKITDEELKTQILFDAIVKRTSIMVAHWQAYGFVHGVINTDNMSILGLTIDYGPFGFLDFFDKNYIPNSSDTAGRYSFSNQVEICFWNLEKLKEAWDLALKDNKLKDFKSNYYKIYNEVYYSLMSFRLGFITSEDNTKVLINDLIDILHDYGLDYINFMRNLTDIADVLTKNYRSEDFDKDKFLLSINDEINVCISNICKYSFNFLTKLKKNKPQLDQISLERLLPLIDQNEETNMLLYSLGVSSEYLKFQRKLLQEYKIFIDKNTNEMDFEKHKKIDVENFIYRWINMHLSCLNNSNLKSLIEDRSKIYQEIFDKESTLDPYMFDNKILKVNEMITKTLNYYNDKSDLLKLTSEIMKTMNPIFSIRRHVLQRVIKDCENKKYDSIRELETVLLNPFELNNIKIEGNYDADLSLSEGICLSCSS